MSNKTILACVVGLAIAGSAYFFYSNSGTSNGISGSKESSEVVADALVEFKEGTHYDSIDPIYGLPKNSVVEVLWYGCPYCQKMEDVIQSDRFKQASVDWNFQQIHLAKEDGLIGFDFKIYAALKQMGLEGTVGKKYMEALNNRGLSRSSFEKFASQYGIPMDTIKELSESDEAKSYFMFNVQFSDRPEFKGVPAFVVNGRYIVNNRYDVIDVTSYLIGKDADSNKDSDLTSNEVSDEAPDDELALEE